MAITGREPSTAALGAGAPAAGAAPGSRAALAAAHAEIARLCAASLPAGTLLGRVSARVRAVLPYAIGMWILTDPDTVLPIAGVGTNGDLRPYYLRGWDCDLTGHDFATHRELAGARRPVTTLHQATGGEPERSARFRTAVRPLGGGGNLRAVFRTGGACWGAVGVVRDLPHPEFTVDEVAFMAGLCPHIAQGLRSAQLLDAATRGEQPGDPGPGMVVLDADDSVESLTDTARWWLARLPREHHNRTGLPLVVAAVARAARAAEHHQPTGAPPRARVLLGDGRCLAVHAARLYDTDGRVGRTVVFLEPATGAEVAGLLCQLHELTTREQQITGLLVRGLGIEDIAARLIISRHTVRGHTKAVFGKLRVNSRAELTALLFYEHALPRLHQPGAES